MHLTVGQKEENISTTLNMKYVDHFIFVTFFYFSYINMVDVCYCP